MNKYVKLSKDVEYALSHNIPVVALESTIISHGMPYPQNVSVAKRCQEIIKEEGATPATVAIIDGFIHIGLEEQELELLGKKGREALKVSRRDIPYCVANKKLGATTVAATMYLANMVGIKVFATGGIGGVHRGYEDTMDVSADLDELGLTPLCVVCAGAKAILDLPRTLEYLETKGVMVIGYNTDYLPAFYTAKSPYKVPLRLDSAGEIAAFLKAKEELGLQNGTLVTNPIPEEYSLDFDEMNDVILKAIDKMNSEGVIGKDTTPYLLAKIVEMTGGKSLEANINLVYNNCRLASNIAKELK